MVTERRKGPKSRIASNKDRTPLGRVIANLGKTISAQERAAMPVDGAVNHDHYIYGTPKLQ